jgi:hypothetical protein
VLERRLAQGKLAIRDALIEIDCRRVHVDAALLADVDTRAALRAMTIAPSSR